MGFSVDSFGFRGFRNNAFHRVWKAAHAVKQETHRLSWHHRVAECADATTNLTSGKQCTYLAFKAQPQLCVESAIKSFVFPFDWKQVLNGLKRGLSTHKSPVWRNNCLEVATKLLFDHWKMNSCWKTICYRWKGNTGHLKKAKRPHTQMTYGNILMCMDVWKWNSYGGGLVPCL